MTIELFGDQRKIGKRPLNMFFIADASGSMSGEKIQSLNSALREVVPELRQAAKDNPMADVYVQAIAFSTGAQVHIPSEPVEGFQWKDLRASGITDMGKALTLVADHLKIPPMRERALPPVLILISDGHPTDDFDSGLKSLLYQPWGKKSIRIAIGIGEDADESTLRKFIGNPELQVLRANNAEQLVSYIRWASTVPIQAASQPASLTPGQIISTPVPIPQPPAAISDNSVSSTEPW